MIGFSEYLTEGAPGKNVHLTHLEDAIIDDGPAGGLFALNVLKEFGKTLDGGKVSKALNVSVKWDGAPALIFGPDPADGKFFVATKGAFAKTPKLAKTHADIDMMYQTGVAATLHLALDELSKLQPKTVLQGDVLFSHQDVKVENISGQQYLTFQPNTILYAVDVNSALAQTIHKAAMGIVIHTMYAGKGKSLAELSASALTPSVFSSLKKTPRVLAMDAQYDDVSGTATFTAQEKHDYILAFEAAQDLLHGVGGEVYTHIAQEPFHAYFQQFINAQIRVGRKLTPKEAVKELEIFLNTLQQKEMGARKTEDGKAIQRDKFAGMMATVANNRQGFVEWFELHSALQRAKDIIVRKLGQASRIASFVRTDKGIRVTGPEGFVAVSRNGKAVKLVDRLEFSRLNFTAPKVWDR